MLGYLANTLIFILVGVVIAQQAFSGVESLGWMYLIVLYFTLIVVRCVNLVDLELGHFLYFV